MKKWLEYAIAAVVFFALLQVWGYVRDSKLPCLKGEAEVYVTEETTPEDVITQLKSQCGIRFETALRKVFERKRVAEFITPGYYKIASDCSAVFLARTLNNAWQTPRKLTLAGSLRLKSEIASKIGSQIFLDSATVHRALNDKEFLKKYGLTPATVYGIIIPDTYEIYWDASLDDLFSMFRKEYDRFWNAERLAKAESRNLTPMQVSTLASIVRSESNYVPEYENLASVYLNRYKRGMRLQACPTVAFVYDYKLTRILNRHLKVDSPYNTYIHKGLPPGPICCPTKAALDAVLDADTSNGYLYFCASVEHPGTHLFAKTYAQHSANARAYQRALDKKK